MKSLICLRGSSLVLVFFSIVSFARQLRPFVIAVAGGSASGKTFYAQRIVEALGAGCATLVSMDHYYAPQKQETKFYQNGLINYDHPSSLDLEKLVEHIKYLKAGFPVSTEEYTYEQVGLEKKLISFEPLQFIVVEGIFALRPEISAMADMTVFVDVDTQTRYQRRLSRDQKERGKTVEEVENYFKSVVEPMHQAHVQPFALNADLIIESPSDSAKVAEIVNLVKNQIIKNRDAKSQVLMNTYMQTLDQLAKLKDPHFEVLGLKNVFLTQKEVGYLNASYKSQLLDQLLLERALNFDKVSKIYRFLKDNPIPVIKHGASYFVLDHHHLLVALVKMGFTEFYAKFLDVIPPSLEAERRVWIEDESKRIELKDLVNNPYRSLAALVRDRGYIQRTGKPHEEFQWASYFQSIFQTEQDKIVTDKDLLDPHFRPQILSQAIRYAQRSSAKFLPGYVSKSCEGGLSGTSDPL